MLKQALELRPILLLLGSATETGTYLSQLPGYEPS